MYTQATKKIVIQDSLETLLSDYKEHQPERNDLKILIPKTTKWRKQSTRKKSFSGWISMHKYHFTHSWTRVKQGSSSCLMYSQVKTRHRFKRRIFICAINIQLESTLPYNWKSRAVEKNLENNINHLKPKLMQTRF